MHATNTSQGRGEEGVLKILYIILYTKFVAILTLRIFITACSVLAGCKYCNGKNGLLSSIGTGSQREGGLG